jgi:hypothetical protein
MNLLSAPLSLLLAPLQAVVLFFAPHAITTKPSGVRTPLRAHTSIWPDRAPRASSTGVSSASAFFTSPSSASASLVSGFVHAGRTTYPRSRSNVSAKPIHRVRVVRNVDASLPADRAGRMVVSGRFADVCAELDKLASMELQAT